MSPQLDFEEPSTLPPIKSSTTTNGSLSKPALLHRSLREEPYLVTSASGHYLTLSDGQKILDACGGAAVACLGHANPEVILAVMTQMTKVAYIHTLSYTTSSAEDLAEIIISQLPPSSNLEKAFFVCSGSEAVDAALKLARQYFFEKGEPERMHIVSRKQAYHGNTLGSMSVSSLLSRKVPYQGYGLRDVSHVSPAYAYQYQLPTETEAEFVTRLAEELDTEFQRIGPSKVIAFIAEPVVGATSGCVTAPKGYFKAVRAVCDKYGILLILDEIMCGMGRTGSLFAFEQEDVVPDLVTFGKGLGGGYAPIAGIAISKKIVDVLRDHTGAFNHGHTYQAHPTSCAAALAVQTIVKRENLVARCRDLGYKLEALLREKLEDLKYVGNIRGRGLFWGVEFVKNKETKETFEVERHFGLKVQLRAHKLGIAVYPGGATVDGVRGDHVLLAPAYTSTEEELVKIVDVLREAYLIEEKIVDAL